MSRRVVRVETFPFTFISFRTPLAINQIPEIKPIIVEKPGLNVGGGAIGIGEITSIPTAPAIAEAYRRYDGELRTSLPLKNTPYAKK